MRKEQGIVISITVLVITATAFSFPIHKRHGYSLGMLPYAAMAAHAPKSAGGEVTHPVLDSAVDEATGMVSVIKAFYSETGKLDSAVIEEKNLLSWRTTYYHSENSWIDSMLNQRRKDGDWVYETKWFFTVPMPQYYFTSSFDDLSEGQGVNMYSDFSHQLSMTAGYGKEWDSTDGEWHYYGKDTLINHNKDVKIYHYYEWDTASNSWQISELDTITSSNNQISQVVGNYRVNSTWYRYRYSYLYDEYDNIIDYVQENFNNLNQIWQLNSKRKYTLTYNDHNNLTSSIMQEWNTNTETWEHIDSSRYAYYSYTYDNSGNITARIDSTLNYWDYEPSKVTHYFKYQTFSAPVIPRIVTKNPSPHPITVSSNGKIKLNTFSAKPLSATLYTLSGRSICRIPLHSDLNLKDYCAQNTIHPASGVYLLRITSNKTGQHFGDWKVFLR